MGICVRSLLWRGPVLLILLALGLAGCSEELAATDPGLAGEQVVTRVPSLLPTSAPSAVPALQSTPLPPHTPETVDAATQAVTRALQSKDATALSAILLDNLFLAQGPNGDTGDTLSRDDAMKWLEARWGTRLQVVSSAFVQHTVMLEIATSGWTRVLPLQNGTIIFHLHRYDVQGQSDGLAGDWRIDEIVYQ